MRYLLTQFTHLPYLLVTHDIYMHTRYIHAYMHTPRCLSPSHPSSLTSTQAAQVSRSPTHPTLTRTDTVSRSPTHPTLTRTDTVSRSPTHPHPHPNRYGVEESYLTPYETSSDWAGPCKGGGGYFVGRRVRLPHLGRFEADKNGRRGPRDRVRVQMRG